MTFPAGIETVVVNYGTYTSQAGSNSYRGKITFTPRAARYHLPSGTPLPDTPTTVTMIEGQAQVTLVASDATGCTASDVQYDVTFAIKGPDGELLYIPNKTVYLSASIPTVDLDATTGVNPESPTGVVVTGAADDTKVVHLAGPETITGVKTFTVSPVVPIPIDDGDVATKAYVDANGGGGGATPDATTSVKGKVQLGGDLAGTAAAPTVPGLAGKEPTITSGTTGQYWRGDKTWQPLNPAAVGAAAASHTHAESDVTGLTAALAAKQASSGDLTAIAGLGPVNDDILQRKSGAWTNRTPAQVKADLAIGTSDVTGLTAALAGKVATSGAETIAGVKTFTSPPVVPTPSGGTDAANKAYVDSAAVTTPDADASTKGKLQLAGDLGGTAASPTVPGLAAKAPLASPTFTGTPAAPTATGGTNTTQVATTAFVAAAVSGKQDTDSDLTQIAGLTPTNNDTLQYIGGVWQNRTPGQAKSTIGVGNVDNTSDATKNAATATLTNKTLDSTTTSIKDTTDTTKVGKFDASAIATATTRTYTLPNASGSVALTSNAQTFTNKTIDGASNTLSNIPESAVTNLTSDLALLAPLASPALTGNPTAPTQTQGNNSTRVATTAYVDTGLAGAGGSTPDADASTKGKVQLAGDLGGTAASPTVPGLTSKAPLASPTFTGSPAAPTQAQADNSTKLATTAYVDTGLGAKAASSHTHAESDVTGLTSDLAAKAPLASPALTGNPTAPTQTAADNSTKIATTAYVDTGLGTKAASSHSHAESDITGLTSDLAAKAPLASPTLTGTPAAPTATAGTNTTQIATTAFVTTAAAAGTNAGRVFLPSDQGLVAWSFDPIGASSNGSASNGIPYLVRLQIPAAVTVTKFIWTVGSAGSGAVAGQNWVGIYDSTGTLLVSAGVDADITSTGIKTTTLASTALAAGWVWGVMLFNASASPSPLKFNNGSSIALANGNLTAANYRYATNGSSRTTLASTITPSSNSSSTSSYWVALAA